MLSTIYKNGVEERKSQQEKREPSLHHKFYTDPHARVYTMKKLNSDHDKNERSPE